MVGAPFTARCLQPIAVQDGRRSDEGALNLSQPRNDDRRRVPASDGAAWRQGTVAAGDSADSTAQWAAMQAKQESASASTKAHLQSAYLQTQQLQLNDLIRGQMGALQERLQLNLVHQTQLLQQLQQCRDKKLAATLQVQIQQLAFEQQTLVQQIQLQQHQCISLPSTVNSAMYSADLQKFWESMLLSSAVSSSATTSSAVELSKSAVLNGLNALGGTLRPGQTAPQLNELVLKTLCGAGAAPQPSHPLYQHGMCAWPSCDQSFDGYATFVRHLSVAHTLDDKSTAQCRVQMQVVEQLESQLGKEKQRLQAMMHHLQMIQSPDTTTGHDGQATNAGDSSESPMASPKSSTISPPCTTTTLLHQSMAVTPVDASQSLDAIKTEAPADVLDNYAQFTLTAPNAPQQIRRRVSDKGAVPIAEDIALKRDFYRTNDIRPGFTYASLIRQAVLEAKDHQLTLNEIYSWFQDTFAYFRRNAATWKNAVRHNLSLHKCFTRVENVKGAVWTVDDNEYYKRRPQRASQPATPSVVRGDIRHSPYSPVADTFNLSRSHQDPLTLLTAATTVLAQRESLASDGGQAAIESQAEHSMDPYIKEEEGDVSTSSANDDRLESTVDDVASDCQRSTDRLVVAEQPDSL